MEDRPPKIPKNQDGFSTKNVHTNVGHKNWFKWEPGNKWILKNVEKHAAFGGTRLVFRTLKFAADPHFLFFVWTALAVHLPNIRLGFFYVTINPHPSHLRISFGQTTKAIHFYWVFGGARYHDWQVLLAWSGQFGVQILKWRDRKTASRWTLNS